MARPVSTARRSARVTPSSVTPSSAAAQPAYIRRNRANWNREADVYQREHGSQLKAVLSKAINSKGPSLVEIITARGNVAVHD